MMQMIQTRGTVHGKTITLEQPIEIAEGEIVELTITRFQSSSGQRKPGEGVRQSAGSWAEDANELDDYLEWNREQRRQSRPEIEP